MTNYESVIFHKASTADIVITINITGRPTDVIIIIIKNIVSISTSDQPEQVLLGGGATITSGSVVKI